MKKVIRCSGTQGFEFRKLVIRRDQPVEERDKMAGGALSLAEEEVGSFLLSCGQGIFISGHIAVERGIHGMQASYIRCDGVYGEGDPAAVGRMIPAETIV